MERRNGLRATVITPWRSRKSVDLNSKPEIVGYFSVDGERNYLPDSSQLLYYNRPSEHEVRLDLNLGIQKAVRKKAVSPEDDERIGHLLEWIKLNHSKIRSSEKNKWIEPKFVGSCGILSKLMCTRFTPAERWIICAAKWKGTIYLCRFKTPEEIDLNKKIPTKYTSWGFKFEQYMLSGAPGEVPDVSKPVVEPAEFRCIYERRFGDHTVLFSAELDGVCSQRVLRDPLPLKELKFVELKTHKIINNAKHDANFKKSKLPRWWTQSFLVGVDEILCGFRDDHGIVRRLKNYRLDEIVSQTQGNWDPKRCIEDCESFLGHIEDTVKGDCDRIIYKYEKIPYGDVITTELPSSSEYAFLPSSFLKAAR